MDLDIEARRRIALILGILNESDDPQGSRKIARELKARGIDLKERMVRYYLDEMDKQGFTENLGRSGRRITELGRQELDSAVAVDRVGFVSARVDQLSYELSFDLESSSGTVIMNISSLPISEMNRAKSTIGKVLKTKLGMGQVVALAQGGTKIAGHVMPKRSVGFGTVCSVTVNGVFYSYGIPVVSRFGGLIEMKDGELRRFTQIINYDGTTIDPIEIFIKGRMTAVNSAARTGNGIIGASFREIPAAALDQAKDIVARLEKTGLNGVLVMGEPGQPLLDVPVTQGRVGMIVAAGLNPIAAVEELGISTENRAMATLCEFGELEMLSKH